MAELFDVAIKYAEKNVLSFLLMFIIFFAINLIIGGIIAVILGIVTLLSPIFILFFSGVSSAISFFILAWYISSLGDVSKSLISNTMPNYINSIFNSLSLMMNNLFPTLIIVILGFIGGVVAGVLPGFSLGASYFGNLFIEGLFYAAATGIALSELTGKRNGINFTHIFNKINSTSSNAGVTLYILVLLPVIPVLGFIQGLLLGLAVLIILLFETHKNTQDGKTKKQEVHKK